MKFYSQSSDLFMPKWDVEELRLQFPLLKRVIHGKELIYFDNAATSLKPKSVIDALTHFYSNDYGTVHRAIYELAAQATKQYCEARSMVRKFINAQLDEEVIFTKGTTEAINLVASSFGKAFVKEGDEILICESEHHSNIIPWQIICQEKGAHLRVIPIDDRGEILLDVYEKLLNPRVKLVAVAHIANSTGTMHPIKTMIDLAHKKGALVLIDGAQSIAHMPIDVSELDADFFAFSGHKAFGPTGIGILYGKKEILEKMPPYQGGGDMVETVSFASTTYQPLPLKFEAGTPMIAEVIGLGKALEFIESLGKEEIQAYDQALLTYATKRIQTVDGIKLLGEATHKGAIVSFNIEGIHPLDVGSLLDIKGIAVRTGNLCAQPTMRRLGVSSAIRLSFAPYNTYQEIDRFVEALSEILEILKR